MFQRNSSWLGTTLWAAAAFSGGILTGLAAVDEPGGRGTAGDVGALKGSRSIPWRRRFARASRRGGSGCAPVAGDRDRATAPAIPARGRPGASEVVEMLLHRERQERAEDTAADGGVGGMEDRPGAHDRLGRGEEVLDKEKIAIMQDRLQRLTFAFVRSTKIPSKRASSASLATSITNERAPLAATLRR